MKNLAIKLLCIFTALTLMFSACGRFRPGSVQARLEAGERVSIGLLIESSSNQYLMSEANQIRSGFESIGASLEITTFNGDSHQLDEEIMSFVESDYDLIICAPTDTKEAKQSLLSAEGSGVPVVLMGSRPEYWRELSGGVYADWFEAGYEQGKMASDWIDQTFPGAGSGQIRAANLFYTNSESGSAQSQGLLKAVSEDDRIRITYTQDDLDTIDKGFDAAETALQKDPLIRLILCSQESPGVGASNFIMSQDNLSPPAFGCFAAGLQSTGLEQMALARNNASVYRGVMVYGLYSPEGSHVLFADVVFFIAKSILLGEVEKGLPLWVELDRWALTDYSYAYLFDQPENDILLELIK